MLAVVDDLEVLEEGVGQLDPGSPAFPVRIAARSRPQNGSIAALSPADATRPMEPTIPAAASSWRNALARN